MCPRMERLSGQQVQWGITGKPNCTAMGGEWNSGKRVDVRTWPHVIHIHGRWLFPHFTAEQVEVETTGHCPPWRTAPCPGRTLEERAATEFRSWETR